MSESHSPRAGRAIPWGLLGMLALVGAIERFAIRGNLALSNTQGDCWRQVARQLKTAARGREVLCFGDSMVKYGLLPSVLRERTGRSAFNCAAVGGSAATSYFLLRRALESGARPATIIVDFDRTFLQTEPESKTSPFPWADLLNLRESVELCWVARQPDLFAWITLARLVPSIKNRHQVRAYVHGSLRGERPDEITPTLLLRRNWTLNQGALVNAKRTFQDAPPPPATLRQAGTWRPHPVNRTFLHRFLDLARGHGIPVVWLLPPVSPGAQSNWDSWGDEDLFETFARAMLTRYTNLVVLDGRHAGYELSVFHDMVHLDRDGAVTLSGTVADLLNRGDLDPTAPTRWVALPAFRGPARAVPLEDLGQSGVAIRQKLNRRDTVGR